MNDQMVQAFEALTKAISAGNYDAAPSTLTQGSSLQIENLDSVMKLTTYENKHIHLQRMVDVESCKATTAQFERQLSYGIFGGSATAEGGIGQEETSDYVRCAVPMSYYSHTRRVTIASTMVTTIDGKKSDERAAADAALKLAGDIEFDLFRGLSDFSNAGVMDGNPLNTPALPNIHGLDLQVRQSDGQTEAQDLMFSEYGSDESVVIAVGGTLTQSVVEDAALRSSLSFGTAEKLVVDPVVLHAYNKITFGKERIMLAGSPQTATGADLKKQWVQGGVVEMDATQWLRGKAKPARRRPNGPQAPANLSNGLSSSTTPFLAGDVFQYYVTTGNTLGESGPSAISSATIASDGQKVTLTITHPSGGSFLLFNVYRTVAGGSLSTAKHIGRVAPANAGTTTFIDLGNKLPGSVTGFLIESDTMKIKELSPYARLKLAQGDLSLPEAHFRFLCLAVTEPRKNVLLDSLDGSF